MNILFLSCHSVLEFDEIRIFQELGHTVFSLHGAYSMGQGDTKRPSLVMNNNAHLQEIAMNCSRENIHPELIEWADVIYVMHRADWIKDNWEKMKDKKIILRTIGQNSENNERDLQPLKEKGVKIVRMSPTEETIPNYQGKDALIRFNKDEDEFQGYTGQVERVVNVSQAMFGNDTVHSRGDHMNIDVFKTVTKEYPWKIFGSDNDNAGENYGGLLSYEDMKNMLRFSRVYFYTGTQPSPYTLAFIEPMMTGIPIVSIGLDLGTNVYKNQKTWEIPSIITNGVNGFISDSVAELRNYIDMLLKDHELAKKIGAAGRARAIELFGKGQRKVEWDNFLKSL